MGKKSEGNEKEREIKKARLTRVSNVFGSFGAYQSSASLHFLYRRSQNMLYSMREWLDKVKGVVS